MLNKQLLDQEFGFMKDVIFLDAAHVALPPMRTQAVYSNYMPEYVKIFAEDVTQNAWVMADEARRDVATLLGCESTEVAFIKNTAEGVGIFTAGYPFTPGQNVIIDDLEHPSNLNNWVRQKSRGLELKVIPSRDGSIFIEEYEKLIDENTVGITVSAVQYSSGFYTDLDRLGRLCKERNILLMVDGIQAVGRLDIDVKRQNIAALAFGGHKHSWGTMGCGALYVRRDVLQKLEPPYVSYQSVTDFIAPPAVTTDFTRLNWKADSRRLEAGLLNFAGVAALRAGVSLINELGVKNISEHVLQLDRQLRAAIKGIELKVVTPRDESNYSGIVCIYYPKDHEDKVVEILRRRRIYATMRGGYIRVSMHAYNTPEHMDAAAEALWEISKLS